MPGNFFVPGDDGNWYNPDNIPKPESKTEPESQDNNIEKDDNNPVNSGTINNGRREPRINVQKDTFLSDETVEKVKDSNRIPNNFPPKFYKP